MTEVFERQSITVAALNDYVKTMLEASPFLSHVYVAGEISNFTDRGHLYFTLKDENAAVKCVMFRSAAARLKFMPENSMKVLVSGCVTLYGATGSYQINVTNVEPVGVGELYAAFEKLKAKLDAKGYFDPARKKPLPRYPKVIGVITSPVGAAVADMKNILSRRYPLAEIRLYPALVQGAEAPDDLIRGVKALDGKADVILLGRGGGSVEDLWAFNSEKLADAVFACQTPVISCVGHETDFTICDFVADLRAPTPSAAAELAVPDTAELLSRLRSLQTRLDADVAAVYSQKKQSFAALQSKKCFASPAYITEKAREDLSSLKDRLRRASVQLTDNKKQSLAAVAARLTALNPMQVLARGYSAVFDDNHRVVTGVSSVKNGDRLTLVLHDGRICAVTQEVHPDPSST